MNRTKEPGTHFSFSEWLNQNSRLVMPLLLAVCCALTAVIGLAAHSVNPHAQAAREAAEQAAAEATQDAALSVLQKDAYPDINALFTTYYNAMAEGDTDTIESISSALSDQEKIRIEELSKYVDSYTDITVYTQQGPEDQSFICYVYSRMKFTDHDWLVPGMQTMYVCTKSDGTLYINNSEDQDKSVTDYIQNAALEDEVVDLTNQVTQEYNELISSDQELSDYLDTLSSDIDLSVGQALAQLESSDTSSTEETETRYVTTTDTVNIRTEPSEGGDVLKVSNVGDRYEFVQDNGDGWYEIICDGQTAYVKSDYVQLDE